MLEDEAVVREQRGLFGGNVYFAVRIERVEVAQGDVRFLREALRPTAVHGGFVEVRMKEIDEGFHVWLREGFKHILGGAMR